MINLCDFNLKSDHRGELVVIESNKTIPFEIKRIYYMYGVHKNVTRGYHAHKKLKQIIFPIVGQCKILLDNGYEKQTICLDDCKQGLLVEEMVWREMYDFSEDCVLMALANEYYDENDYIRCYEDFLNLARASHFSSV